MQDYRRTHTCGELSSKNINHEVVLSGWVHKRRDLGGLIFIDLRDRYGITQLIFDPNKNLELHEKATRLRSEWVLSMKGKVIPRASGMQNSSMKTGEIEIQVLEFEILSEAKVPPFSICDETIDVNEELRLKYRYLDIRRGVISKNLILRHKAMLSVRKFMDHNHFIEVQTPILYKSTPEGAREYLVPSRIHPGSFYALPQSPQVFKQLLMISGIDRYFQLAPCFRDEDLRAERQPEFTQIDIEMSFAYPKDLRKLSEGLVKTVFQDCLGIDIPTPFEEVTYQECIEHYGTDKPDLRFGMPLVRIDDLAKHSTLSVFLNELESGGCVKGLCVKEGAEISRKGIDHYIEFVSHLNLKGLVWIKKQSEGYSSSASKYLSENILDQISHRFKAATGDLILLAAGKSSIVNQALDHLRRHIAKERNLIPKNTYRFLWVVDFPMFEWDEEEKKYSCVHHPFTSPKEEDFHLLDLDPLKARSNTYDLVLNGYELGGGSQRIFNQPLQEKIFSLLKLSEDEIKFKMGFFVEALKYGTPPHLGIAFGFDRLMMILCGTDNIKDVIAFPKSLQAVDLMCGAPSRVQTKQLDDLKIKTLSEEMSLR